MKYVNWILKYGTKKVVIVWCIAVLCGIGSASFLTMQWIALMWKYIFQGSQPAMIDILIGIFVSIVLNVSWLGYYFSDRQLFFNEFMAHSENYMK